MACAADGSHRPVRGRERALDRRFMRDREIHRARDKARRVGVSMELLERERRRIPVRWSRQDAASHSRTRPTAGLFGHGPTR